ncbi:hypothetical protein FIBSPDRAFT_174761 [Athelia psychrophila]|uniref:Uncharacterized protein n=1 Tax=Athelia psychrophila TaxID=1759441 RepID=A0A166ANH6_9AGAM|nr:hypothetical protein FIBSPDRAFT_174761 [Fibularhizoctonia sp. CBS 109695]
MSMNNHLRGTYPGPVAALKNTSKYCPPRVPERCVHPVPCAELTREPLAFVSIRPYPCSSSFPIVSFPFTPFPVLTYCFPVSLANHPGLPSFFIAFIPTYPDADLGFSASTESSPLIFVRAVLSKRASSYYTKLSHAKSPDHDMHQDRSTPRVPSTTIDDHRVEDSMRGGMRGRHCVRRTHRARGSWTTSVDHPCLEMPGTTRIKITTSAGHSMDISAIDPRAP